MSNFTSVTDIPTPKAGKYLQQVCKHWAHNLDVTFDSEKGRIIFPKDARGADWPDEAVVKFETKPNHLTCQIKASAEGQRDGLKGAVERHIDRFAFREGALTYNWNDG